MKKLIAFFVFIFLIFTPHEASAQKLDCKKFKNGTFKLVDKTTGTTYIIKRKGTIQTEEIEGAESKYSFQVDWIDDCSYMLKATEETLKRNADFKYLIKVEIVETKEKSYVMRATIPDIKAFSMESELFLLE